MSDPQTIRELVKRIEMAAKFDEPSEATNDAILKDAVAALALLDNATKHEYAEMGEVLSYRLVPDPAPRMSDEEYERLRRQFVESTFPAPRGDDAPNSTT
jgi:hypothetical protein